MHDYSNCITFRNNNNIMMHVEGTLLLRTLALISGILIVASCDQLNYENYDGTPSLAGTHVHM